MLENSRHPRFQCNYRNDRENRRDGGVAIFIKDTIIFKTRLDFTEFICNHECLWIVLCPRWLPRSISKIVLACVYLPPSLSAGAIEDFYVCFCCYDMLTSESLNVAILAAG